MECRPYLCQPFINSLTRCGHCKSLAPEWSKAAAATKDTKFKLAKLDATANKEAAQQYEIKGFPTIKFFQGGKFVADYQGGRKESDIVSWIQKKSGPTIVTIESVDQLTAFQEKNAVFVLGYFSSATSPVAVEFAALAEKEERIPYAITTESSVLADLAVSGEGVSIFSNFDEPRVDYPITTESIDVEEFSKFVVGHSSPLIQEFSADAAKTIFASPITKHALFFTVKEADYHAPIISTFKEVAGLHRGKLLFVNVPSTETKVLEFFGLTPESLPKLIVADMGAESGIKKYAYGGAFEAAEVNSFIESFFAGGLKPTLKSEDIDAADATGPVVVLRGESFHDLVINNEKDVLVEFYAPWCGHCKKLGT